MPELYLLTVILIFSLIYLFIKNIISKNKLGQINSLIENKNGVIEEQQQKIKYLEKDLKLKLKKARNVHQKMLPDTLAEPANFFFSDYYQPAEYIGGDYYNVFEIEHGAMAPFFEQYLIYFFDVSGHGIDSTLLSIFINDSIENYFKLQHSPGEKISTSELIDYIDQQYQQEDFPDDYLVCLYVGLLDNKNHTLTYSSGGFQFPIYKVNNNKIEELNIGGLPISTALGALADRREEKTINFEKDTSLVLSTDGLLEQSNGTETYINRFEKLLSDFKFLPVPFLKDLIQTDFYNFINEQPNEDDITFLLLERPQGEVFNYYPDSKEKKEELKSEIGEFIDQNKWRHNSSLAVMKEIAFKIIEKIGLGLELKALNNQDLVMLSFKKDKNYSNWDFVFTEYPELISVPEKNINPTNKKGRKFSFGNEELYYSYNKQNSRLYLLLFKKNFN